MIDERLIIEILQQPEFAGFEYENIIGSGGFATVAKVEIPNDKVTRFKDYEISSVDNYYALKIVDIDEGYDRYKRNINRKGTFEEYRRSKVNSEYEKIKAIPSTSRSFEHIVPIIRHQQISLKGRHYLCLLMPYYPCAASNNLGRYADEIYTVEFAEQVCEGLQTMHNHDLIHRDLKPGNILEMVKGFKSIYKITDLGGIREIQEGNARGNTSMILWSGIYTAPECIAGAYSFKSDIYSLGMCIARFRFMGQIDEFKKIIDNTSDTYLQWPDYYSKDLQKIINNCIQYNPRKRYNTASEVLGDLRRLKFKLETNTVVTKLEQKLAKCQQIISNYDGILAEKDNEIIKLQEQIRDKIIYADLVSSQQHKCEEEVYSLRLKNDELKKYNETIKNELRKSAAEKGKIHEKCMNLLNELQRFKEEYIMVPKPKAKPVNPEFDRITVGETYSRFFGEFEGNPLEWVVLDKDENTQSVLLLSKQILCNKQYNNSWDNVLWKDCDLQKYLNNDFYNHSFTKDEKEKINLTTVDHYDTKNRVFLLSVEEAKKYFETNQDRIAKRMANGEIGSYWLRTPGVNNYNSARIFNIGGVDEHGYNVDKVDGVRPAIWVRI